ncbi:hypothetical protein BT63DRAFT_424795 [Microthyrium microscopicum]|uniref:Uncharacterized protein n=1 Tax=Microthyrium microscopicum TaxID=703497 RepID=A0A6A6UCI5_9PEZI|nr:hypothetical protein BT63DRAFT_424795 [Microthyrium microscopicum]
MSTVHALLAWVSSLLLPISTPIIISLLMIVVVKIDASYSSYTLAKLVADTPSEWYFVLTLKATILNIQIKSAHFFEKKWLGQQRNWESHNLYISLCSHICFVGKGCPLICYF